MTESTGCMAPCQRMPYRVRVAGEVADAFDFPVTASTTARGGARPLPEALEATAAAAVRRRTGATAVGASEDPCAAAPVAIRARLEVEVLQVMRHARGRGSRDIGGSRGGPGGQDVLGRSEGDARCALAARHIGAYDVALRRCDGDAAAPVILAAFFARVAARLAARSAAIFRPAVLCREARLDPPHTNEKSAFCISAADSRPSRTIARLHAPDLLLAAPLERRGCAGRTSIRAGRTPSVGSGLGACHAMRLSPRIMPQYVQSRNVEGGALAARSPGRLAASLGRGLARRPGSCSAGGLGRGCRSRSGGRRVRRSAFVRRHHQNRVLGTLGTLRPSVAWWRAGRASAPRHAGNDRVHAIRSAGEGGRAKRTHWALRLVGPRAPSVQSGVDAWPATS